MPKRRSSTLLESCESFFLRLLASNVFNVKLSAHQGSHPEVAFPKSLQVRCGTHFKLQSESEVDSLLCVLQNGSSHWQEDFQDRHGFIMGEVCHDRVICGQRPLSRFITRLPFGLFDLVCCQILNSDRAHTLQMLHHGAAAQCSFDLIE